MLKGIVLFDIKDFLYQGLKGSDPSVQEINQRQSRALEVLHTELFAERERRLSASTPVPTVDIFLPTGDGYYLLCRPDLADVLDISRCVMALLDAKGIDAYCVAHVGEVNVFTDMTGRDNATGFDLGFASRLQGISQIPGTLVCSETLANMWQENDYFDLHDEASEAVAKDGVEYRWRLATPKHFSSYRARFNN